MLDAAITLSKYGVCMPHAMTIVQFKSWLWSEWDGDSLNPLQKDIVALMINGFEVGR